MVHPVGFAGYGFQEAEGSGAASLKGEDTGLASIPIFF